MRMATAAAGRHQACKTKTTNPGGGKESSDHASARAGVRIAATPARAALVPCDILKTCRRVVIQYLFDGVDSVLMLRLLASYQARSIEKLVQDNRLMLLVA
jgi:hypothetical protein